MRTRHPAIECDDSRKQARGYTGRVRLRVHLRSGPRVSGQPVLRRESELLVDGLAGDRGVQANGFYALAVQKVEGMCEQRCRDAPAACGHLHQDHRDPGDRSEAARHCGSHGRGVEFRDKTPVRLHVHESPPVRLDLVPACLPAQPQPEWQIGDSHGSNLDHNH